jgi:glucose/mannose-6-phosphate isomerase
VTTGGRLAALLEGRGAPVWRYAHKGDARGAVAYLALLPLAALMKLGLVADKSTEVAEAAAALTDQQSRLRAASPVARNPAKRMAGQLMNRIALIFAGEPLTPAARRWQGQINQLAKAACHMVALSDADHSVAGTFFPEALISKYMALWLRAPSYSARTTRRAEAVREIYMTSGFNTDVVDAVGASPLAHVFTAVQFGDYAAYYLAMCYGVDPTPTPQIDELKARLA